MRWSCYLPPIITATLAPSCTLCSAAISSLPGVTINPDYGFTAGSNGYLDFFFDGKMYMGIELTRDGKELLIHSKRFAAGGTYASLRLSSWAVVDFRMTEPRPSTISNHPGCLFVCMRRDFAGATLIQLNRPDEVTVFHSITGMSNEASAVLEPHHFGVRLVAATAEEQPQVTTVSAEVTRAHSVITMCSQPLRRSFRQSFMLT
jgi:hypothetical protein